MLWYMGTHEPSWLRRTSVPLFVSARRLRRLKRLPQALAGWALDSGGFTELSLYGQWVTHPMTYSTEVRRWAVEIGRLDWAAPQDWMCEPWIVAKTGLSVAEHQRKTACNYLLLRQLAPDLPWIPVLQGWAIPDYLRHIEMYGERGVDLTTCGVVGLGSVCRRQATTEIAELVHELWLRGLKLHGFGLKTLGLRRCGQWLTSADSMAWSYHARRSPPLDGCRHQSCANCLQFALQWRAEMLASLPRERQQLIGYRM